MKSSLCSVFDAFRRPQCLFFIGMSFALTIMGIICKHLYSYSGRFPQIVQSGCIFSAPSPIPRKKLRFQTSEKPEGDKPYPAKWRHSFTLSHQREHYCLYNPIFWRSIRPNMQKEPSKLRIKTWVVIWQSTVILIQGTVAPTGAVAGAFRAYYPTFLATTLHSFSQNAMPYIQISFTRYRRSTAV